jgi:TatD DNase family protein
LIMIDTHCHLTDERLANQLDGVLSRALQAGVGQMVTIGTHPGDWQPCLDVCRSQSRVRCALGVHPNYCNDAELDQLSQLTALQSDPAVVAVGEMGLDYHYDSVPVGRQRAFFETQLAIAATLGRPAVIHSRQAIDDCLAVLKNFPTVPAVFHCFTGTTDEAHRILDAGYLIGFTGVVTFKKTEELRKIAQSSPVDRILVETDAPYLSPEPVRSQKINEPALVMHVAALIANLRGLTLPDFDRQTTDNAKTFYRWND